MLREINNIKDIKMTTIFYILGDLSVCLFFSLALPQP